jgi:predicted DNA-binding ribbon-helix-helix protein
VTRHLAKRSVRLAGHATSIALEPEFWTVLEQAAARRGTTLAAVIAEQDAIRAGAEEPLASRLRVFALREASGEA